MTTIEVLEESLARAELAILYLEASGDFRFEGLTLTQWEEAANNYAGQILEVSE